MRWRGPCSPPAQRRLRTVRRLLAARGFNETVSYSFIPRAHAALFGGGDEARQLENPIAADLDAMRPCVLPSLLAAAARNQARGISDLMLFEIGAAFDSGMPGDAKDRRRRHPHRAGRARLGEIRPRRRRLRRQGRHAGRYRGGDGQSDERADPQPARRPGITPAARARWRSARR